MTDATNIFSDEDQRLKFENSQDAYIVSESDTVILFANRSAHRIFGYGEGEMIGTSILKSMPEDKRDNYLKDMEDALAGKTVTSKNSPGKLFAQRKNGEAFPIELEYYHYIKDLKDLFVTRIKDISVRKEFEKESSENSEASAGRIIDSVYKIQKKLGSGAQGDIYHVKTTSSGFDLALKMITVAEDQKEKFRDIIDSVKEEFTIIKSLHHRNIIGVYDFGYDRNLDRYYYTMDYLQGTDLGHYVASNPNSARFPDVVYQILDGLNYLHSNSIIHFDIKPENIFIINSPTGPIVKILDFGLSEVKRHNKGNVEARGTISYMAPEFFLNPEKISPKIDLYSLGITLIHINKGFSEDTSVIKGKGGGSLIKALNEEYDRNMELLSEFKDRRVRSFISQLTEKNPGTRISSAVEAIVSLNNIFGTDFKIPAVHHMTSFLNNPKFVLRGEMLEQISTLRENALKRKEGRTVILTGVSGSGKTKILDQMMFEAGLDLQKAVKMYFDDNTSEDFLIGKLLLRKTYNLYSDDFGIKDDYERILADIDSIIEKEQDFSYIYNDIIGFILKCSSFGHQPLTVLLDSFDRYDHESVKFVNRLMNINKNSGDLFLLISVATDKMNEAAGQSYRLMEYDPDIQKVDIPLLSYEETEKAVDIFLGRIGSLPPDFVKKVYDHTRGNYRKLMQCMDELFQEGVLNYVSGLLLFRDNGKFSLILKDDSGKTVRSIVETLEDTDVNVLRLLCVTFNKLTIEEIKLVIPVSDYDLKKTLKRLFELELISGYQNLYKAVRKEVKDYVFKQCSKQDLIDLYGKILEIPISDKFSQYAFLLIRTFMSTEKRRSHLNMVGKYIDKILKLDSNDNLYYLLLNSLKIAEDNELRFRLEINYAYYLDKKDKDKAVKLMTHLDRLFRKKGRIIDNRISFIRLKLRMLDPEKYNYNAYEFIKTVLPVMQEGMKPEDMYTELLDFVKKLLVSGVYFDQGAGMITMLEEVIKNDRNVSFEYPDLISAMKFIYGVVEWKDEYENVLAGYINDYVINQKFNSNYFFLIRSIAILSEKGLIKGDYSERLNYGLEVAYRSKHIDSVFEMYTILSNYYFYKYDYEKSLYWDQKKIDLKQKLRKELTTDDIGDIATAKANLYYPVGEVITLIQETRRQAKENNELSTYITYLTNEFILLHRKGDFKNAKSTVRKAYLYFRTIPGADVLRHYERVAKYYPEVFSKEECLQDVKKLRSDGTVSEEVFIKMNELSEKFYEYNICYRWSPDRVEEILSGSLELETPMMLLHYLKSNRKLPDVQKVMGKVDNRFYNTECTGDHLSFMVTKFMLTKETGLIDRMYEFSRKLHIDGYVMINVYTMIPFMEFALMVNVPKKILTRFIDLYEEINNYLYGNMDDTQLKLFESTYFFRRGRKIIEYYNKL
ncbi:MAG: protein kinase [Candidatus Delongbacteria bacterium]|nr:protein kinase [Candidatus Delongbacteria bacterium]